MVENRPKCMAVIVPVYNEAGNLNVLYSRVKDLFAGLSSYDWRLIFVNDGSSDDSWDIITEISQTDPHVSGLCLSRNFGKELAMTAAIDSIDPAVDATICIDADLQHPVEMIPDFIDAWENGAEIVVGIRNHVSDYSFFKKISSKLFYSVMKRFSDLDMSNNNTDFRLLDKKVIQELCRFRERGRMFRGLIDWMGFKKTVIEFSAPPRPGSGVPSYSYKKLFNLAINSFTSFSLLPLRITGYMGIFVSFFSGLLFLYMLITDFVSFQEYTPQAYFVVFNTLLVGVMLSAIGMIALYIGNIHTEVLGRPLYIIREKTVSETNGSENEQKIERR